MPKVSYMGNGSTIEFNFDFPFYENADIVVTKNATIMTSGYAIIGTPGGLDANIPYIGGKVVFDVAPIATDSIVISRHLSLIRVVDYQPTAKINPTTVNQDMNYMILALKDFGEKFIDFEVRYAELLDIESIQTISAKIDTVTAQIEALGDISTVCQDVDDLITTTADHTSTINAHTSTIGSHTTSIAGLDNRTSGLIDYVIESQMPNAANNYTWYRKYKSGWVEQGGRHIPATSSDIDHATNQITLPVEMADTNYAIFTSQVAPTNPAHGAYYEHTCLAKRTSTTSISVCLFGQETNTTTIQWQVQGISA
ncbi:MAG: hypothetical protein J6S74_03840 [Alphaproteobacteria bacterium]|nr:hypothetical protein [Alphaproteobacteria bacterium]